MAGTKLWLFERSPEAENPPHQQREFARRGEVDAQRSALEMYPHLAHSGLVEFLPGVEDEVMLAKPERMPINDTAAQRGAAAVSGLFPDVPTTQIDMNLDQRPQTESSTPTASETQLQPQSPPQPQQPEGIRHRMDYELSN